MYVSIVPNLCSIIFEPNIIFAESGLNTTFKVIILLFIISLTTLIYTIDKMMKIVKDFFGEMFTIERS